MSTEEFEIREKDKLDNTKIDIIFKNWYVPEEEDISEMQKAILYLFKEIMNIKSKYNEMIEQINENTADIAAIKEYIGMTEVKK